MADLTLDVGIQITPASIRSIQSDVRSAFSNISPKVDIDEAGIRKQLDTSISSYSLVARIQGFKVSDSAINKLQASISDKVKVRVNSIEADKATLESFKRQVQEQAKIAQNARADVGRAARAIQDERSAAGSGGSAQAITGGGGKVKELQEGLSAALAIATQETNKLIQAEAALQLATLEAAKRRSASLESAAKLDIAQDVYIETLKAKSKSKGTLEVKLDIAQDAYISSLEAKARSKGVIEAKLDIAQDAYIAALQAKSRSKGVLEARLDIAQDVYIATLEAKSKSKGAAEAKLDIALDAYIIALEAKAKSKGVAEAKLDIAQDAYIETLKAKSRSQGVLEAKLDLAQDAYIVALEAKAKSKGVLEAKLDIAQDAYIAALEAKAKSKGAAEAKLDIAQDAYIVALEAKAKSRGVVEAKLDIAQDAYIATLEAKSKSKGIAEAKLDIAQETYIATLQAKSKSKGIAEAKLDIALDAYIAVLESKARSKGEGEAKLDIAQDAYIVALEAKAKSKGVLEAKLDIAQDAYISALEAKAKSKGILEAKLDIAQDAYISTLEAKAKSKGEKEAKLDIALDSYIATLTAKAKSKGVAEAKLDVAQDAYIAVLEAKSKSKGVLEAKLDIAQDAYIAALQAKAKSKGVKEAKLDIAQDAYIAALQAKAKSKGVLEAKLDIAQDAYIAALKAKAKSKGEKEARLDIALDAYIATLTTKAKNKGIKEAKLDIAQDAYIATLQSRAKKKGIDQARLDIAQDNYISKLNERANKIAQKKKKQNENIRDFAAAQPGGGPQSGFSSGGVKGDAIARAKGQAALAKAFGNTGAAAGKASVAAGRFNLKMKDGSSLVGVFAKSILIATKRLALYAVASQLVFGLISALSAAKDEVIKLDEQSRRLIFFSGGSAFAGAKEGLDSAGDATSALTSNMNGLLQASIDTGLSLQQTTEILVTIARVGQEVDGAFASAVTSLVRLEAGALNAETAVTNLNAIQIQFLNTLTQYSDAGEDAAAVTENISNIAAVLAATSAKSAANVTQLSNATVRVGAALSQIQGLNANTTIALLGEAFNATGANASRLGTSMRQLSTLIVKNADEIKELSGIEVLGEGGQIKGFESILEVLEKVKKLEGTAQGIDLISQIADQRSLADVQALAGGVDKLRAKFGDFSSVAGQQRLVLDGVGKAFDADAVQAESLGAGIESLKSQFIAVVSSPIVSFIKSLTSNVSTAIGFITTIAKETAKSLDLFQGTGETNFFEPLLPIIRDTTAVVVVLGTAFVKLGALAFSAIGGIISVISDVSRVIENLEGAFLSLFSSKAKFNKELQKSPDQGIDLEVEKQRTKELSRAAKLLVAKKDLRIQEAAAAKKDLALAKQEEVRLARITTLRAEALRIQKVIANNALGSFQREEGIVDLKKIEAELEKRNAASTRAGTAALASREILQLRLNVLKAKEANLSLTNAALAKNVAASLKGTKAVTVPIQFDNATLKREISGLDDQLKNLKLQARQSFDKEGREKVEAKVATIAKGIDQRRAQLLTNEIRLREAQVKKTTEEGKKQAKEFENAGKAVATSFSKVVTLQQGIADVFKSQGRFIQDIIKRSGEQTAKFLDSTGSSIESRLANIINSSDRQIAEIRRTQRSSAGAGAGNVQQAVGRVIGSLQRVSASSTAALFSDVTKFESDVNTLKLRTTAATARAVLDVQLKATAIDIKSRRDAINAEISVIRERISAEQQLIDLRIGQQREFGRLLLEAPSKFVDALADIDIAEQFFEGITDLSVESLRKIQDKSRSLRGGGQSEVLGRVLSGLQSASKFGRDDVASGIGNAQLQGVFERLQTNSADSVLKGLTRQEEELKRQTEGQKRIKELQAESRTLDLRAVDLQQQQIRLEAATSAIAAKQRNDSLISLSKLRQEASTNAAGLLAALRDQRETLVNEAEKKGGGLGEGQVKKLAEIRARENAAIAETTKQRLDSAKSVKEVHAANIALAKGMKDTVLNMETFAGQLTTVLEGPKTDSAQPGANGASVLDTARVFKEIGESLRPLKSGNLQIVSPQLADLRKAVEKTGGTREQRKQLKSLESQSRKTIGGGSADAQGREAAKRFLKDKETAKNIETGFRALLQDRSGGIDTNFVEELKKLRGEGKRGAAKVDITALRRLLGNAGLDGVADNVNNSRQGAKEIDRLLKLSDELSENQKTLSRVAGKEIKRILSQEIAEGIRDLREEVTKTKDAFKGSSAEKETQALQAALKDFSIASPQQVEELSSEISKVLNQTMNDAAEAFRKTMFATANAIGSIKVEIPSDEAFGLNLSVSLANGITSADFARDMAVELKNAGIGDDDTISRLTKQLVIITEPLIRKGIINASSDFVRDAAIDLSPGRSK